jgi:hypothetical protein
MLQVERSLGRFYYRSAPDEIDALFERVDGYFVERGLRPPPPTER